MDGAYVRVHHFARQLASPVPAARGDGRPHVAGSSSAPASSTCATRTRCTWPRRPRRPTCSATAGCSSASAGDHRRRRCAARRRSATCPPEGSDDADLAREKTALFLAAVAGQTVVDADPRMTGGRPGRLADPAAVARPGRPHLVGVGHPRHRGVDGAAGHEPDELDAAGRGHRRAVRRAAGRADRPLPRRLGRGRLGARAAGLGEPQRPADRQRPGPRSTSAASGRARTRSASSRACGRGSARATSASPTSSPRSWPRTPPSARPTPCCSRCRTCSASTTTPGCCETIVEHVAPAIGWVHPDAAHRLSRLDDRAHRKLYLRFDPASEAELPMPDAQRRSKPRSSTGALWVSAPTAR